MIYAAQAKKKKMKAEMGGLGADGSKIDKRSMAKIRHSAHRLAKEEAAGHKHKHRYRKEVERNLVEAQVKETSGLDLSNQKIGQPTESLDTASTPSYFFGLF
jgi:hypothetical protein